MKANAQPDRQKSNLTYDYKTQDRQDLNDTEE